MKKLFLVFIFIVLPMQVFAFDFDLVSFPARRLASLQGVSISSLRVLSSKDGANLQSVVFQVDEKVYDPSQKTEVFVLDSYFSRRTDKLSGNGKLDGGDELVLSYEDGGVQLVRNSHAYQELEVSYQGHKIYYYLSTKSATALKRDKSKVSFNAAQNIVESEKYKQAMQPDNPLLFKTLTLKNGSGAVDILDHFKIDIHLGLGKLISADVNEENLTSQRIGYREGPLRTLLRVESYKKIGPLRVSPKSLVEFIFSPKKVEILGRLENPLNPEKFSKDSLGNMGLVLSPQAYGMSFFHNRSDAGIKIDAQSNLEKEVGGVETWVLTGSQGHFLVHIEMEPKLEAQGFVPALYYKMGAKPYIAYSWDMKKYPKGAYRYRVIQIFPDSSFSQGQERGIFKKILSQVHVKVNSPTH